MITTAENSGTWNSPEHTEKNYKQNSIYKKQHKTYNYGKVHN